MATKESQRQTVTVGGKTRVLVFDYAALCELCDAIGATVSNMQEAMASLRVGQMHLLLWAGLLDGEPSLTPDAVKAMLKGETIPDAQAIIGTAGEALNAAMVRPKAKGDGDDKPSDPPKPTADQSPGTTS